MSVPDQSDFMATSQKYLVTFLFGSSLLILLMANTLANENHALQFQEEKDSTFQTINPRKANPLGIALYGGSPALFASLAVDYFVSPALSMEVGGGAFGIYGGARYHLWGKVATKNWTPYLGLLVAFYGEAVGVDNIFFFPVGIQYSGGQAFFFAFELSAMSQAGPAGIPLWGGLKLGFRF